MAGVMAHILLIWQSFPEDPYDHLLKLAWTHNLPLTHSWPNTWPAMRTQYTSMQCLCSWLLTWHKVCDLQLQIYK